MLSIKREINKQMGKLQDFMEFRENSWFRDPPFRVSL